MPGLTRAQGQIQNSVCRLVKIILVSATLFFATQCSVDRKLPVRESHPEPWERIFLGQAVGELLPTAKLRPLLETPLGEDETEIRIWRGFGVGVLEGLILKRTEGRWAAVYLEEKVKDTQPISSEARLVELSEPKSGWEQFWQRLSQLNLLRMEPANAEECYGKLIDGTSVVVEISQDGRYRTYMYQLDVSECRNSSTMGLISEYIGEQFDDGHTSCTEAQWFACAKVLSERRLSDTNVEH